MKNEKAYNQLDRLLKLAEQGAMSRRAFMAGTITMGVHVGVAAALYSKVAKAEEPKTGGTIRIGLSGGETTDTLDPALAAGVMSIVTGLTWGEKLLDTTPDGQIDMRLATDISSSPDAIEWIFQVRNGVRFHNGDPVTAEDVVATLKRHSDEKSHSGALGILKGIKNISSNGDKVIIRLVAPNIDLPYLLTDFRLVIQPNGGLDNPNAGIGAGPYKVVAFEPGVRIKFVKYTDYFDSTIGHAEQIEILAINDDTARTSALRSGQVHMMNRVSPKIAKLLDDVSGMSVKSVTSHGHYVFVMRCDTPPFDNNDMRMALKLAIKRREMVEKVLSGYGTIGNDFPINATYPLFDETIPQREYDSLAAADYYKKTGHDGSSIILRTAAVAFPGAVDAANLFAASAQSAGIPLQVKVEPDDGYWASVWNVKPFCMSYWSGRTVQDPVYSMTYLSTADWNDTRFDNKEFDDLLFQARGELDQAKRKGEYSKMAHILRDEGGVIIPMFNDFLDGVRDEIHGWYEDPNAEMMNYRAHVKCWIV